MGQYTDKINRIAKDFAEIEYYEKVSALEAYNGKFIIHYNHRGKEIQFRTDGEHEGIEGKAGETKFSPPLDEEYIRLKAKYDHGESWQEQIGKWWKKVTKITHNPRSKFFIDK